MSDQIQSEVKEIHNTDIQLAIEKPDTIYFLVENEDREEQSREKSTLDAWRNKHKGMKLSLEICKRQLTGLSWGRTTDVRNRVSTADVRSIAA